MGECVNKKGAKIQVHRGEAVAKLQGGGLLG